MTKPIHQFTFILPLAHGKKDNFGQERRWDFIIFGTKNEGRKVKSGDTKRVFIPITPQNRPFRHFLVRVSRFIHHTAKYV